MENNELPYPPGVRFCPTDKELVVHYLANKIKNLPLPSHLFTNDVKLYDYTPDHLAATYNDMGQKEWYFFTARDRKSVLGLGRRANRVLSTMDGYWKTTTKPEPVKDDDGVVVGIKRNLVFYEGEAEFKRLDMKKTNWLMNEYCIDTSETGIPDNLQLGVVLCRIYNRDHKRGGALPPHHCQQCPALALPQQNSDALSVHIPANSPNESSGSCSCDSTLNNHLRTIGHPQDIPESEI